MRTVERQPSTVRVEAVTTTFVASGQPDGIHDLVGNVHEWTADPAGTFRGGYYSDTQLNRPGCAYATVAHDMGHSDYSTGFRCCANAPTQ